MISKWMTSFLGTIGTAAILLLGGIAYFIWRFNPEFSVPKIPSIPGRKQDATFSEVQLPPEPGIAEEPEEENNSGAKLLVDESLPTKNGLKKKGGVVVLPPVQPEEIIPFDIIEKEENTDPLDEPILEPAQKVGNTNVF